MKLGRNNLWVKPVMAAFLICHLGASKFAVKDENFGVFTNFRDFDDTKALRRGSKAP